MAKAILDACTCAGKSVSSNFHTIDPHGPGMDAPGLVKHWAVTYDVQVRILGVVDEAFSASIDDVVEALPGHPAPVEAIYALIDAGLLTSEPGDISPHTRISLASGSAASGEGGIIPSGGDLAAPAEPGSNVVTLRSSVVHSKALGFVPEIFVVDIADRADLPAEIDGPIIYYASEGQETYTGKSGRGRTRVLGPHLNGFQRLMVIQDAAGLMNERQAGIAERILCLILAELSGQVPNQKIPNGERCDFWEYLQLRLFVSQALLLAKEAGLAFDTIPVLQLLAGSQGDPERQVVEEPYELEGITYHLYAAGMNARATEYEGEWIVHAGSEVRSRAQQSGSSVTNNLRHEWLFSGILKDDGDRFRLTEPVSFSSGSAAANFVLGSKCPNLAAWTPSSEDGPNRLSSAL